MSVPHPSPRSGRPRSADVDAQIFDAVLTIVAEEGYSRLTMEGIAARSGVSKASIYRRFRSRGEAAAEALLARYAIVPDRSEGKRDAVERHLARIFAALNGPAGPIVRGLMADAQLDSQLSQFFRDRFIMTRRKALGDAIALEFGTPRNVDLALDLALGAMWYRLLVGHASLSDEFAHDLARIVSRTVQNR